MVARTDGRRSTALWIGVGSLGIALALIALGWFVLVDRSDGGPIDGSAKDPDAFLASFPVDWKCQPASEVDNPKVEFETFDFESARVLCRDLSVQYLWIGDNSGLEDLMPKADEPGCTIKSGNTIAGFWPAADSSPPISTEDESTQYVIDSFAGDVETIGTDCP